MEAAFVAAGYSDLSQEESVFSVECHISSVVRVPLLCSLIYMHSYTCRL